MNMKRKRNIESSLEIQKNKFLNSGNLKITIDKEDTNKIIFIFEIGDETIDFEKKINQLINQLTGEQLWILFAPNRILNRNHHSEKDKKMTEGKLTGKSCIELFKELGKYDPIAKKTEIVSKLQFTEEYAKLNSTNGTGWARLDTGKYHMVMMDIKGKMKYSANLENIEEIKIEFTKTYELLKQNEGEKFKDLRGNILFKIEGVKQSNYLHPISKLIKDEILKKNCVHCGATQDITVDHKNDLYNDRRVLLVSTQTIDDFQPLCISCQAKKRGAKKWRETNAKRFPYSQVFGDPSLSKNDYFAGNETFDQNDPNALFGTYWYDIQEFRRRIAK